MQEKFKNIPVDKDTKVLLNTESHFGPYDCVLQKWLWDGIYGNSLIFMKEDVKDYAREELRKDVLSSGLMADTEGSVTFSESSNHPYLFVNFNFGENE